LPFGRFLISKKLLLTGGVFFHFFEVSLNLFVGGVPDVNYSGFTFRAALVNKRVTGKEHFVSYITYFRKSLLVFR